MTELVNLNKKIRQINYLSKDFDAYREDLIEYIKRYYPDQWEDFSDGNAGMAILELMAYMGDSLSYLVDRQINECFLDRAQEEKNIMSLAQNLGYKPKSLSPAVATMRFSVVLQNSISANTVFKILKGAKVATNTGREIVYETIDEVDFGSDKNRTSIDLGNGTTQYTVSNVRVSAGSSRVFSFEAPTTPIPFYNITIPDSSITELTSVTSSDGYEWYEVNNLSQESIFYGDQNLTSSSGEASYILKYKKIPRRFTTEIKEGGGISIVFGSGVSETDDYNIIPNPEDFVLPNTLRGSVSGFSPEYIDSSNFLRTNTLGVAPSNVTIDVNYRVGGGLDTNAPLGSISRLLSRDVVFYNPDVAVSLPNQIRSQLDSIECINTTPALGGGDREPIEKIKANAIGFFNSQGRVITLQDYQVRAMSLPSEFGRPYRVFARKDKDEKSGVELITIGRDSNGHLTSLNDVVKNNIEEYIKYFKSFSDTVNITDGKVANFGIDFEIVANPNDDQTETMIEALTILKDKLNIGVTNFNDSLVISDLMFALQSSRRIISVPSLKIYKLTGTVDGSVYSSFDYDLTSYMKNGIVSFPKEVIWELKYPNKDLKGRFV